MIIWNKLIRLHIDLSHWKYDWNTLMSRERRNACFTIFAWQYYCNVHEFICVATFLVHIYTRCDIVNRHFCHEFHAISQYTYFVQSSFVRCPQKAYMTHSFRLSLLRLYLIFGTIKKNGTHFVTIVIVVVVVLTMLFFFFVFFVHFSTKIAWFIRIDHSKRMNYPSKMLSFWNLWKKENLSGRLFLLSILKAYLYRVWYLLIDIVTQVAFCTLSKHTHSILSHPAWGSERTIYNIFVGCGRSVMTNFSVLSVFVAVVLLNNIYHFHSFFRYQMALIKLSKE